MPKTTILAEPLKFMYNESFLSDYTDTLKTVIPDLDEKKFKQNFDTRAWHNLELKQRVAFLNQVTDAVLPQGYEEKMKAVGQIIDIARKKGHKDQNFVYIFLCDIVARHGMDNVKKAVPHIEKVTAFTSFEFAGRLFFLHHPEEMIAQMVRWAKHPNENIRRYASEGCRPRLPWGLQLKQFVADPRPIIPVLESLKDDTSEYVRKSVANNLNDISKDHPDLVLEIIEKWQKDASPQTMRLLKSAARTLLKKGHPKALALFGNHEHVTFALHGFTLTPEKINMGEKTEFQFTIQNTYSDRALFRIEYFVYFQKANGSQSKKIFKISDINLTPGETKSFIKKHGFADLTTRKHYPGEHSISIVVNGQEGALKTVTLSSNM